MKHILEEFRKPIATPCPTCTAKCTCGSGCHPRECEFHGPLALEVHRLGIDLDGVNTELMEAVELLKDALDRLIAFEGKQRDGTSRAVERWLKDNCHA